MVRSISFCLFLFFSVHFYGESVTASRYVTDESTCLFEPYFHQVSAQKGDGILSLLRRYRLSGERCNVDQFLTLNELEDNANLVIGKSYYLPVLIYQYNGKTIRSSVGIDNFDKAKRIETYNLTLLAKGLRQTNFKDSKILWVPYNELKCETAPEKPQHVVKEKPGRPRRYQIFGEKHAHTPLLDNTLQGKVFYIVSGHGGPDPGAMGKRAGHTLCEDEYAYDIGLRLAKKMVAHGAIAYVITRDEDGIRDEAYLDCDNDETVWEDNQIPLDQVDRLYQRANAINKLYKRHQAQGVTHQRAIMLHIDSRQAAKRIDVFFYHHEQSRMGKRIARHMHKTMKKKYAKYRPNGDYAGTVTARNLYMLRQTQPTSVYVELGNIQHPIDQMRFTIVKNRQYLAEWLFEGITTANYTN